MHTSIGWNSKQAVVVGASSGLGLHLALALAKQRANLILVARDPDRLHSTQQQLLDAGAPSVETIAADLTIDQPLQWSLFPNGSPRPIDLLINAVGRSDRGNLWQLTPTELTALFQTNVITALQSVRACREGLIAAKGCIVNIGSLASKIAAPGLGGYAITKFGLAAFSQQLRYELQRDGVHCMLVCPGPIQRSDAGSRYAELVTQRGLDPKANQPAGGAKLKALDPTRLAQEILHAAAQRQCDLISPNKVRWLAAIATLWPRFADRFLSN